MKNGGDVVNFPSIGSVNITRKNIADLKTILQYIVATTTARGHSLTQQIDFRS